MNDLSQLTACVSELAAHASNLAAKCRQVDTTGSSTTARIPQPLVTETSAQEILQIKQSIAISIARLQKMVQGPTDFLQHLAYQIQLLACIQWLGEFQILAFIPLDGSVPLEDIAELASVPKNHLSRIIRLTATAGFLQEPPAEVGHVAHTALSAHFVTKLSYLDAAMFLSDLAAPTALQMAKATKRFGQSENPSHSAYNMARGTAVPFASVRDDHQSKMRRQWPAYLKHVVNNQDNSGSSELLESLGSLDRLESSSALIVEVAAESAERAILLARRYPNVQFAVQMTGSGILGGSRSVSSSNQSSNITQKEVLGGGRIIVSRRAVGSAQLIRDAAIYILDLSVPSLNLVQPLEHISAELHAHVDILRSNSNSALVLMSFIAPGTGAANPEGDTTANFRDLCLFQLHNQQLVTFSELSELVNNTNDRMGRLSVVRKAFSRTGDAAALEVRYIPYPPN